MTCNSEAVSLTQYLAWSLRSGAWCRRFRTDYQITVVRASGFRRGSSQVCVNGKTEQDGFLFNQFRCFGPKGVWERVRALAREATSPSADAEKATSA